MKAEVLTSTISLEDKELVLTLLADTPRRIETAVNGQDVGRLAQPTTSKAWSVSEIMAHLRGCADVWPATIYAMLREDNSSLSLYAPREWVRKKGYARLDFHSSFQVFTQEREELLRVLSPLPLDSWERGALIAGREHTVFSQAKRLALHEQVHCLQIEEILR